MTVTIYVEGGGQNSASVIRCKRGFDEYCRKLAPAGRRPTVVACGSRERAFDRFQIDLARGVADSLCVLLVDSESPVQQDVEAVTHLQRTDGWRFPPLRHWCVFLMVQAMEAWLFADRDALATFYGNGFRPNALRGSERSVEAIAKDDLEISLIRASREARTKGQYKKATHAFELIALIDPGKVESASPHAAAFNKFLRAL